MIGLGIGLLLLVCGVYLLKVKVVGEIKKNFAVDVLNAAKDDVETKAILQEAEDIKGKSSE